MDFMKVIDQTVREIKREVNMKVLKIPEIEQKVLDTTSNEPWGPHGSALAEIAQATKKFMECQIVMNVLWSRLTDSGWNWRHVYKALVVIEYLMAHGSERAVDDIVEHTFQISSLSSFEYVEPNGKDMGLNVRKKSETIMGLVNSKDKLEELRNKAAANRDKYIGLSSMGITYKSRSASYSGSSYRQDNHFGGLGSTKDGETLKDGYRGRDQYEDETEWKYGKKDGFRNGDQEKSRGLGDEEGYSLNNGAKRYGKDKDDNGPVPSSQKLSSPSTNAKDDFDPRGSSASGPNTVNSNQVDLFSESLIDIMDAMPTFPEEKPSPSGNASKEVDLFADATFVSATTHTEALDASHTQADVDLFGPSIASTVPNTSSKGNVNLFAQSAIPGPSSEADLFAAPAPPLSTENKPSKSEPTVQNMIDPFAAVPLNTFESTDIFGDFTGSIYADPTKTATNNVVNTSQNTPPNSTPSQKEDTFQVKSGIWADSLSRGLIDLNITATKKTSLKDIGIVGELSDGLDEKDKVLPSSAYMGRATGMGAGIGRPGFSASTTGPAANMTSN